MKLSITIFYLIFYANLFAQIPDSLKIHFEYNKTVPLDFKVEKTEIQDQILINTINFKNDKSENISAYLLQPKAIGRFPGIIYQHWGEDNKEQFLEEAESMAKKGFICLLVNAPWLRPPHRNRPFLQNSYTIYTQGVIDLQRGLDFLQTRSNVDTSKIYFVGHSYGAHVGGILAGIEPRIKGFILMSGTASLTELLKNSDDRTIRHLRDSLPEVFSRWRIEMKPLNAENYIKHSRVPVFFQYALNDEYNVDELEAKKFVGITPQIDLLQFYRSTHTLNKEAEVDRIDWLSQRYQIDASRQRSQREN
jgi:dienelactone hydrolase